MLRYIIGIVISLIAISFVRAVVGIISKSIKENVEASVRDEAAPGKREPAKETQLRKCASCGTYKPEPAMIRYGSGEKSVFFCSADCEKKAAS